MKKWWKSKTLVANGLIAVAGAIQLLTGNTWLDARVQAEIVVLVNVVLRIFTNSGLEK
jgi:hypothetical protein|tara:strand:- start:106 stop:279 length:174 start_codon:yes stop_codon:yes gene_type:complete